MSEHTSYDGRLDGLRGQKRRDKVSELKLAALEAISNTSKLQEQQGDFLAVCKAVKIRIAFIGHPNEPMNEAGPDWSKEVALIEAAEAKSERR